MKVAKFKYVDIADGWISAFSGDTEDYCPHGYIRVSEWVDVDFPELDESEVIARQVMAIDHQLKTLRADFQEATSKLSQRKSELLALPVLAEDAA